MSAVNAAMSGLVLNMRLTFFSFSHGFSGCGVTLLPDKETAGQFDEILSSI